MSVGTGRCGNAFLWHRAVVFGDGVSVTTQSLCGDWDAIRVEDVLCSSSHPCPGSMSLT